MEEQKGEKIVCKICKQEKYRIRMGLFNHKSPRYIDAAGKYFNGKVCPQCNLERIRNSAKARRAKV